MWFCVGSDTALKLYINAMTATTYIPPETSKSEQMMSLLDDSMTMKSIFVQAGNKTIEGR